MAKTKWRYVEIDEWGPQPDPGRDYMVDDSVYMVEEVDAHAADDAAEKAMKNIWDGDYQSTARIILIPACDAIEDDEGNEVWPAGKFGFWGAHVDAMPVFIARKLKVSAHTVNCPRCQAEIAYVFDRLYGSFPLVCKQCSVEFLAVHEPEETQLDYGSGLTIVRVSVPAGEDGTP